MRIYVLRQHTQVGWVLRLDRSKAEYFFCYHELKVSLGSRFFIGISIYLERNLPVFSGL